MGDGTGGGSRRHLPRHVRHRDRDGRHALLLRPAVLRRRRGQRRRHGKGVTADTIKVVLYLAQEDDAILNFITQAINDDDTNADAEATYRAYTDMFNDYYQTYGRKVELEVLDCVWAEQRRGGGASRRGAGRRRDGCIRGVGRTHPDDCVRRTSSRPGESCASPARSARLPSSTRSGRPTSSRVGDQRRPGPGSTWSSRSRRSSAGRPAEYAGDPALAEQERKFGYIWIEANETSEAGQRPLGRAARRGRHRAGRERALRARPGPPAGAGHERSSPSSSRAGVTSVIFSGDPVALATFTREATAQDYCPEWILGPQALVDTAAFSRTYDQEQWSHAFGISPLTARIEPELAPVLHAVRVVHGRARTGRSTRPRCCCPQPALFFAGLQAAGPNLTPETFAAGLQSAPPDEESAITQANVSFGDQGSGPTRTATAPTTWSRSGGTRRRPVSTRSATRARACGPTSTAASATCRASGRRRSSEVFDPEGTVTIFDEPPPEEAPPDYPSPNGG